MANKDFNTLKENVLKDIKECSNKELDKLFDKLKSTLKTFDRDDFWKNVKDVIKQLFKNKRTKCSLIVGDICDSRDKLNESEKESLRKAFLDLSNIHRTFLEDLQALFGAL